MSQIDAPGVEASTLLTDSSPMDLNIPGDSRLRGIKIDCVSKTFNPPKLYVKAGQSKHKVVALKEFSLDIVAGEAMGIIGPNGAGKTTLMGCLLGFLRPDSGSILIDGLPPNSLPIKEIIGYLPERLNFDNWMTARRFVTHHHELAYQPENTREQEVEDLLTAVGLDSKKWDLPVGNFSRGMLQRVGLAQALVGKPKYLFLDEPASGLDPRARVFIKELLKALRDMGKTIFISSHILSELADCCNKVGIIEQGVLLAAGGVRDILSQFSESLRLEIEILSDPGVCENILHTVPEIKSVEVFGKMFKVEFTGELTSIPEIHKKLTDAGVEVLWFKDTPPDLEDVFMRVTKGEVA